MLIKYFEGKSLKNLLGVYYVEAFETQFSKEEKEMKLVMYFPYGPKRITIANCHSLELDSHNLNVMYAYKS